MIKAVRRFVAGITAIAASVAAVALAAGAIAGASSGESDPVVPCYVLSMERMTDGTKDDPAPRDWNANGVPISLETSTVQPSAEADCVP